jgi:hypothetical protein
MSIESRISRLVKKMRVKKSRWIVPLSIDVVDKVGPLVQPPAMTLWY